METFSALLAICAGKSPVAGKFPTQRPVTRSFDIYIDVRLNKRLRKQWYNRNRLVINISHNYSDTDIADALPKENADYVMGMSNVFWVAVSISY